MKIRSPIRNTLNGLNYNKIIEWVKLTSIIGGAQIIVQIINLISGIIVIRLLPTKEYALYTLAYTMLGLMTILADSGIANSVMAIGGGIWRDRNKLGSVLSTGLLLRRKFAIISLLIILPIMIYFLKHHNASNLTTCLITISLIPPFFASLSGTLLEIPIKLHQNINALQKIQIVSNIIRLLSILLTLFTTPLTYIAILSSVLPQIWLNKKLKVLSNKYASIETTLDEIVKKKILSNVKYILPNAIYRSLSSQITLWLVSLNGATSSVAQIGALGRVSIIIRSANSILGVLIIPRFARRISNNKDLIGLYCRLHVGLWLICIMIVITVWYFSQYILFVFGDSYKDLSLECILISAEACICLMVDFTFALNSSKGIILHPFFSVFCQFLFLLILILLIPLNSLAITILIGITVNFLAYVMNVFIFLKKIRDV